jgi:outer membrane beta-barrel protein
VTSQPATRALLAALLLAAAARPAPARATSKADAFEGKIQPISGQLYRKAGRLELTPLAQLSVNDAFFTKYFGGLKATYHLTEFWSVGGSFAAGATAKTGSAVVCPANQGCQPASATELYQVPGRLRSVAGLEVAWAPVYGKLNVLAEKVAHFDLSLVLGADLVAHDQVLSGTDASAPGASPGTTRTVGGHVGLGARLFVTDAVALRLEFRDLVYRVTVPNRAVSGQGAGDLQNQLFTELGVSVFFPFTARAGRTP